MGFADFLNFLYIRSCHLWIEIVLFLSFQFVCFFFCLTALAKTFIITLNRNGKLGLLALFLILQGRISVFNHCIWSSLWVFHKCPLLDWGSFLPLSLSFYQEMVLNFIKYFSAWIEVTMWAFFLSLYHCGILHWLLHIEAHFNSENKFYLIMVYSPFNMLLNFIENFFI